MENHKDTNCANFTVKKWHLLTERPGRDSANSDKNCPVSKAIPTGGKSPCDQAIHPCLEGASAVLMKLLWDILVYLYSSVSIRIRRLGISARAFEKAKIEGCEKEFFIESSAGQTIYLVPTRKTFETFNMPYPYKRDVSLEHSYYLLWGCFILEKDPRYKSVQPEVKRGDSGSTSDIVTVAHDGTRETWEVTLSTTNVLANASKYDNTNFARIVFLCRDYKLKEAVKACCREGGLNPDLLAKLEYMQFSTLLRRQRKLSLY